MLLAGTEWSRPEILDFRTPLISDGASQRTFDVEGIQEIRHYLI